MARFHYFIWKTNIPLTFSYPFNHQWALSCPYILTIVVIILQCTWGCTSLFSPLIKLVLIVDTKTCMFHTKTCREPPREIPPMTKVMWRRPDRQRQIRTRGIPWTCSSIFPETKICLSIVYYICLSPTLLTFTGGYPRPPFSEENQLRALVNKSPGLERSISILTPLLAF